MIKIDEFQPYTSVEDIEWPTVYPFTITLLLSSGEQRMKPVRYGPQEYYIPADTVAVKISDVQDADTLYYEKLISESGSWKDTIMGLIKTHKLTDPDLRPELYVDRDEELVWNSKGYGIRYHDARNIYLTLMGKVSSSYKLLGDIRTFSKNENWGVGSIEYGGHYVKIGCQKIDTRDILDLAKREGW